MPITILLLVTSLWQSSITVGRASQYGHGVMEGTIRIRQGWNQLPQDLTEYSVFVAVPECSEIGRDFWIRPVGAQKWEHALATDCASRSDYQSETDFRSGYQWMIDGNILVEIDGRTARRWNTVGRMIRVETVNWLLQEVPNAKQDYTNRAYTAHPRCIDHWANANRGRD